MPKFPASFSQQGASLVEYMVLIILILIFIWIATVRVWELHDAAEQTGVAHMIGTFHSALAIDVAKRVVDSGIKTIGELDRSNPFDLLQPASIPNNYLGELDNPDPGEIEGYRWYFDKSQRQLVYRVGNADDFHSSLDGPARIRVAIQIDYQDQNRNKRFDEGDAFHGINVVSLDDYRWTTGK